MTKRRRHQSRCPGLGDGEINFTEVRNAEKRMEVFQGSEDLGLRSMRLSGGEDIQARSCLIESWEWRHVFRSLGFRE